jgi:NTP pyrophosphatase (non-canonical NTP hydrolase)
MKELSLKEEILDIDAQVSCIAAALGQPNPDLKKAIKELRDVQDRLLELASGIEEVEKN